MEIPQMAEPSLSQKRFPFILTKTNMNAMAETSFTMPKMPVRKREEDTDVKPADMNITGASVPGIHQQMPRLEKREWKLGEDQDLQ